MKRLGMIGLVLICVLVAVGTIIPTTAADSYIRGDADGDGHVSVLDATAIQRKLVDYDVRSFDPRAADVTGDGVNILDATLIQQYIAGFDNIYHIDEMVTVPDPTTSQPTAPQSTRDPYELPIVPNN